MISDTLKIITDNFEKGFTSSTLMGWGIDYDKKGRPLNSNPNYRSGTTIIEGKQYWFTRKGWKVRIWDREANYMDFLNNKQDFIEEVDLTPDYLKNEYS